MPNLVPPVKTVEEANAYRERIMAHVPEGIAFDPRMVLYFTNNTAPSEVLKIKQSEQLPQLKACQMQWITQLQESRILPQSLNAALQQVNLSMRTLQGS